MSGKVVATAVSIGVACSIAFIAGYLFRANYGGDRQPIINAMNGAEVVNMTMSDLTLARMNSDTADELAKIKSLDQLQPLKEKYRANALRHIDSFDRSACATNSESKREMLEPLKVSAEDYRRRLGENH